MSVMNIKIAYTNDILVPPRGEKLVGSRIGCETTDGEHYYADRTPIIDGGHDDINIW